MDTVTSGRDGSALFVYLIREWLSRYDSPRNLTVLPWCTMWSMTAAAMSPSPNTSPHLPDSRFGADAHAPGLVAVGYGLEQEARAFDVAGVGSPVRR